MSIPSSESFLFLKTKDELSRWADKLISRLNQDIRTFAFPASTIVLVDGNNDNVTLPETAMLVHITGPTVAYIISGLAGGRSGRYLVLYNDTAAGINLTNEDVASQGANRIITPTGGNIGGSVFTLVYSTRKNRWIVTSFF